MNILKKNNSVTKNNNYNQFLKKNYNDNLLQKKKLVLSKNEIYRETKNSTLINSDTESFSYLNSLKGKNFIYCNKNYNSNASIIQTDFLLKNSKILYQYVFYLMKHIFRNKTNIRGTVLKKIKNSHVLILSHGFIFKIKKKELLENRRVLYNRKKFRKIVSQYRYKNIYFQILENENINKLNNVHLSRKEYVKKIKLDKQNKKKKKKKKMPQFDQFSFFNQVYWFLFIFFNFYFFVTYFFLPRIVSQMKFRKKKIQQNYDYNNLIFFEKNNKQLQLSQYYFSLYQQLNTHLNNVNTFFNLNQKLLNAKKNVMSESFLNKINTILNKKLVKLQKNY